MKRLILVCASILAGGCSTTPQLLTPFPAAPIALMAACERPQPLPAGSGAPTAAQALQTVTSNYARHHRCADRLDSLQEWVREQEKADK